MDCPDCVETVQRLKSDNIDKFEYELLDVSDLMNLKKFISLRDCNESFNSIRGTATAGLPCFYDSETKEAYLDLDDFLTCLNLEL